MATLKACVQKMRNDGFFPIYIRVTHNRTTQYIKTDKIVNCDNGKVAVYERQKGKGF